MSTILGLFIMFMIIAGIPAYLIGEHKEFIDKYLGGEHFLVFYMILLSIIITIFLNMVG